MTCMNRAGKRREKNLYCFNKATDSTLYINFEENNNSNTVLMLFCKSCSGFSLSLGLIKL